MNTDSKKLNFDVLIDGKLFKELKEYPNYFISEDGQIFYTKIRRILAVHPLKNGCLIVKLNRESKKPRTEYVHRLVAQTWLPNPNNYDVVHRLNNDKRDNRASNLKWISRAELSDIIQDARKKNAVLYKNIVYDGLTEVQEVNEVTQRTVYNWKDRGEVEVL